MGPIRFEDVANSKGLRPMAEMFCPLGSNALSLPGSVDPFWLEFDDEWALRTKPLAES